MSESHEDLITLVLNVQVDAPPEAEVASAVEGLLRNGIRFFTLESAGDSPDTRYKLYELVREGVVDDPSTCGTFMDFEAFSQRLFYDYYWRWADCQFLAADGIDWVGLTNLQLWEDGKGQFGVTVVKRAHRRRGIARALKLLALQYSHRQGVRSIRTQNDRKNEPILRLNQTLSFKQV